MNSSILKNFLAAAAVVRLFSTQLFAQSSPIFNSGSQGGTIDSALMSGHLPWNNEKITEENRCSWLGSCPALFLSSFSSDNKNFAISS